MNGSLKLVAPVVAALAIAACNAVGISNMPSAVGASQSASSSQTNVPEWKAKHLAHTLCPQVVGKPTCLALQSSLVSPLCSPSSGSCGFTPSDLETAYGLTSSLGNGSGQTVAVVEAGDDATASSDLATYRSEFSLGTANLNKYNEHGQQYNYPPTCANYGWCLETGLDIEMISAACPKCTIDLIEAKDSSPIADFETAETTAVSVGATIVSNSWICYGSWDCGDANFPTYFDAPGTAYLASSGDSHYNEIGGPSVLASVIAVGGTQLTQSGSTYSERIWPDAGAGCASPAVLGGTGIAKPSWQTDPGCSYRTDADVSAESGCNPGVAIYLTSYGSGEWISACGTSAASPFTAGVIALAGNATNENGGENFWKLSKKKHKTELHDIKTGSDGACGVKKNYLCEAGAGKGRFKTYSGPGGWGTPNGVAAY